MAWTADTYEYPTSSAGVQSVWDYIHSEESWNAAYNKTPFSALQAYEDINRTEDLYSETLNRRAEITDMICEFTSYDDKLGTTEYANWTIKGILYGPLAWPEPANYNEVEVVTNSIDWFVGTHFYLKDNAFDINEIKNGSEKLYELYTSKDNWTSANIWVKINKCEYPWFGKSWKAWNPQWAVINLPISFKGTISVQYNSGEVTYPWGSDVNLFKAWYAIKGVGSYSDFDPTKLTITLIPAYTVTFDINGWESTAEIENQDVLKWKTATKPTTEPTREGYIFMWWYNWETEYKFTEEVTANVELTAKWLDESNIKSFSTSDNTPFKIVLDWDSKILKDETLIANQNAWYNYTEAQLMAVIWWNLANVTAEIVNIKDLWWDVLFVKIKNWESTYTTKWFLVSNPKQINYFWTDEKPEVTDEIKNMKMDIAKLEWPSWAKSLTNYEAYNEVKDAEGNLIWYTVRVRENPEIQTDWYIYVPVKKYYTISLWTVSNGTISSDKETAAAWDTVTLTPTPASNYNFSSWTVKDDNDNTITVTDNKFTMPAKNVTVSATFTAKSSGGSSSWGGRSSKSSTKATDNKWSVNNATWTNESLTGDNNTEENNNEEDNTPMTLWEAIALFWDEQIDAYQWALENGITTMDTVEKARLDQPLTRAELAKMMVVYMQKVLKADPVVTWEVKYLDVDESLWDLAWYIQLAYQYQIMGINADGTSLENFNPNGVVTRWEYATVFSRVLFGSVFNKEWADFYTNHLEALKEAWILKDTTPTMQEIRWWVMLMMYRSSQNTEKIEEVAAAAEKASVAPAEQAAVAPVEGTSVEPVEEASAASAEQASAASAEQAAAAPEASN